jgi:type IV pilus assembly protein PilB
MLPQVAVEGAEIDVSHWRFRKKVPPQEVAEYQVMKGDGCANCNDLGYKGRIAIYEVMPFTDNLKQMVYQNASQMELKKMAVKEGMKTLRMSALTKLKAGMTSVQEVIDSTPKDELE